MIATIDLNELLEFMRNGQSCQSETDADGNTVLIPLGSYGYDDTILKQEFDEWDYRDCESEKHYIERITGCYLNQELEASNGDLITFNFK